MAPRPVEPSGPPPDEPARTRRPAIRSVAFHLALTAYRIASDTGTKGPGGPPEAPAQALYPCRTGAPVIDPGQKTPYPFAAHIRNRSCPVISRVWNSVKFLSAAARPGVVAQISVAADGSLSRGPSAIASISALPRAEKRFMNEPCRAIGPSDNGE